MERDLLVKFLIFANAIGAAYGFIFYYGPQLLSTAPWLWAFVPDCPLDAFLFAVALVLLCERAKADWFYFVVFVGAVKYGFWTMFVLWKYSYYYFQPDAVIMYSILFVSHAVLFLEPALMLGRIKARMEWFALALFWFLLNDFADYALGTAPPIPSDKTPEIFAFTVIMTLVFTAGSYLLVKKFEGRPLVRFSSGRLS